MKVAFVGKGGSGKTTLAALLARHLTASTGPGGSAPLVLALDVAFLREQVGDDLLTWVGRSAFVKAGERGRVLPIADLEPANAAALATMRAALDGCGKDWALYTSQAVQFHLRNAAAWASDRVGEDLTGQIDPEFALGPAALSAAR